MVWRPRIPHHLAHLLGGVERAKVIAVLAGVFALDGADMGAIGAMTIPLGNALSITRTEIGLLLTAALGMGALATVPFGMLVDRVNRIRLLTGAVVVWGAAMIMAGAATSYTFLLITQIVLGGAAACTAPAVASLIGDYFIREERGQIFAYVLSGELVGTGIGLVIAGELATWSWRAGLIVLGPPALLLAWVLRRIPEPARGGASRLGTDASDRPTAATDRDDGPALDTNTQQLRDLVRRQHVEPRERLLLDRDPSEESVWWSIKYVLGIPTNRYLIIGSALGYFYFAGLRTFGVAYLHDRFGVVHEVSVALLFVVGVAAVVGVLISGRASDALIQRGQVRARIASAAIAFGIVVSALLPAFVTTSLWLAMLLFAIAAAGLGAINPPLDSARLDIMMPGLWGRAEATRMVLRKSSEAVAPLTFGAVADHVFGGANSLNQTFLFMLSLLVLAGLVAILSLRTYPRDVATVDENLQRIHRSPGG